MRRLQNRNWKVAFSALALAFVLTFALVAVVWADDRHEEHAEDGYEHHERGHEERDYGAGHDGHHDEHHGYMLLVVGLIGAVALSALVMSMIALRRTSKSEVPASVEAPSVKEAETAAAPDSTTDSDPDKKDT